MTKKGLHITERILYYLERNPDGLKIGTIQKLIDVSRNSVYRYLETLELRGLIAKLPSKLWILKSPIKPRTIPGYLYQEILQGLKEIGQETWDIETDEGKEKFKLLGKIISPHMKFPKINLDELRNRAHHQQEIIDYTIKIVKEATTVENFKFVMKLTQDGYPDPDTNLAALITFEGGYIASDPVSENGFAHYYILAGIFEEFANKIISAVYGGRTIVNIIKIDEENQIVDLGVYIRFNKKHPYIDFRTGKVIPYRSE
jgi:predicted DNA-binding transcriptional regulator